MKLYEIDNGRKFISQCTSLIGVITHLKAYNEIVFIEEDADNPGCYDILTKNGKIFTVEKE